MPVNTEVAFLTVRRHRLAWREMPALMSSCQAWLTDLHRNRATIYDATIVNRSG